MDSVWSHYQACVGESSQINKQTKKPKGFGRKDLPSLEDNYSPFKRQLLAWYWAFVETELLTVGQNHDTILPELPIMRWMLSDRPSYEEACSQLQPTIKWKWYTCGWTQLCLEITRMLHEEFNQIPVASTPITMLSSEKYAPIDSWNVSYN